jgi:hypothetical protein
LSDDTRYWRKRSVPAWRGSGFSTEALRRSEWDLTVSSVSYTVVEGTVLRRAMRDSMAATGFVRSGSEARRSL